MSRRHSSAFTLIELLIVVAIIAILAAIAVPNFLEAQVRSKVSRVKSDFRSCAVGMEAYMVDHNSYPIPADGDGNMIPDPVAAVTVNPMETRVPLLLTTPIAYITSISTDPFAVTRHGESRGYQAVTLDYINIRRLHAPTVNWLTVWNRFFRELSGKDAPSTVRYFFASFGPDQDHDAHVPHITGPSGPHTHGDASQYDPTNGTISSGDLFYFGPGIGFDPIR